MKRTRINRVSAKRAEQNCKYIVAREGFLRLHPVCQIWICEKQYDESEVVAAYNAGQRTFRGELMPQATQIHHRNKRHGERLLDQRWWMAVCRANHERVEANKSWARDKGYLLPINADDDGKVCYGINEYQFATTSEAMARFKRKV